MYQEEAAGRPRLSGAASPHWIASLCPAPRRGPPSTLSASSRWWCGSSRRGSSPPPGRSALRPRRERSWDPGRRGVVIEERQLLLRRIPHRPLRPGARALVPTVRPGLTLRDLFDADVSGQRFQHGKPHPEMFLAAAESASRRGVPLCWRMPRPVSRRPRPGAWQRSGSPGRRRRPAAARRGRNGGRLARRGRPRSLGEGRLVASR